MAMRPWPGWRAVTRRRTTRSCFRSAPSICRMVPATRADAYVVNVGDILMRWSNDVWVSTPHRVANPPAGWQQRRLSIPFFFQANYDAIVECLPTGDPPKYLPVSVGAYRAERFA